MGAGNGKRAVAAIVLGAAFLCGCAVPRTAEKNSEPQPEVRLPIITPLKIERPSGPPVSEPSITPTDVVEGRERSLKLFQIDYERQKAGPAIPEDSPSPTDNATQER